MPRKFSEVFPSLEQLNKDREFLNPEIPSLSGEEWVALVGRYAESQICYHNEMQFKAAFFTIMRENLERLRTKLRANARLRSLEESEVLEGDKIVTNIATNPDTEPSTEEFAPLPYVNSQNSQKGMLGKVKGLYNWKHSVGGQAYNEFLDGFRDLFIKLLLEEETVYEN